MKKLPVLIFIILICPLIAGVYGILHDQLTYTISPEYFTKFKFIRFGIDPQMSDRLAVCKIGFLSTWWAGMYVGLAIGFTGLIHHSSRSMRKISLQSILIALTITLITGLVGLGYGFVFLSNEPREYFFNWFIPENLEHYNCYIAVGTMHNCSYIGGAIGLAAATFWQFFKRQRSTKK